MANSYFTPPHVTRLTTARAAPLNDASAAVAAGFDLLPAPAALQGNAIGYCGSSTGSAGAYVVTTPTPWPAVATGQTISFIANHANPGGGETVNVNGAGAVAIRDNNGASLAEGVIPANGVVELKKNSGYWQLMAGGAGGGSGGGDTIIEVTEVTAASEVIRPEDFDLGSDALNLAAAFSQGISTGTPVRLDGTYTISAALSTITMTTGSLTVLGSGKIHVTADLGSTPAITFHATYPTAVAVTAVAVESHTFPESDQAVSATKITASGHGLSTGDIFKIVADDVIPNSPDADAFIGQFGHAADVSGTSFWMGGRLVDTYSTNKRVVRVRKEARLIWDGPGFSSVAGNAWNTFFLRVRGFVQPRVRLWVRAGYTTGVDINSCLMADVDIEILGLLNDVTDGSDGYGVRDSQSAYSQVRIRSIDCRHAYTTVTNAASSNDEPYLYGRTIGALVTGVSMGGSAAPFDTHSEGTDITFANCSTGNSYVGPSAGGQSVTLRGANNRAINCTDRNSVNGYSFVSEGEDTTTDCELVNCRYFGGGAPFRINNDDGNGRIIRPRITGGFGQSSVSTMVQAWDCSGGVIDGLTIAPTGASGTGVQLYGDADLTIRNLTIDLRGYTGVDNFRAFAFDTATTGNRLVVESAQVIGATGKLKFWFHGNDTSGEVILGELQSDAPPADGIAFGVGSLDLLQFSDGWTLIDLWDWSVSGDSATADFTDIAYDEVRVIARAVTKGTTGTLSVRASVNNGSSYLSSSGSYIVIAADGQETNLTMVPIHVTNATAARSGTATLSGLRNSEKKIISAQNAGTLNTIETTSTVNAIRVLPSGGGNLTGGTITLLGR
jgi:hypothetical protein